MQAAPQRSPRLRLGAVPYLNARPLCAPLERARPGECTLSYAAPSRIPAALSGGELDVGLMPSLAVLSREGLRAADGVAIGSDGPVRSVLLLCRTPLPRLKTLALDPDSMSSNALARILLAEAHGLRPEPAPADMADARLLIGDPALAGLPGPWEEILDLGGAWKDLTGLPFVYALWAGPSLSGPAAGILRAAKQDGLSDLERIAREDGPAAGIPFETALPYLRDAIRYDLGDREREGLQAFAALARAHGLLPRPTMPAWA